VSASLLERSFGGLLPLLRLVLRRPATALLITLALTVVAGMQASQLRIDAELSNLIPPEAESVQALERLRATVGGGDRVDVAIQSPSFEANRAFAEEFLPRALDLRRRGRGTAYFERVEYRREIGFLEENALYFATDEELDELERYLDERLWEARQAANPLSFDLEDDEDGSAEDGAERLRRTHEEIVGREYPTSADSTVLVLRFHPSGSQTDVGFIEEMYAAVDSLATMVGPPRFHPDMEITVGGRLLRRLTEVRSITRDVTRSFGAGVTAVLLVVAAYFAYKAYEAGRGERHSLRLALRSVARMPLMGLLIGLPFLASLTWTFALAQLIYGHLNIMTSTLGLVLFGLGIDYGLHFYARYTEERGRGADLATAAEATFHSTGQAIAVSALTTAGALAVLMASGFRGFSQFGAIASMGILFALLAMTFVLPALLAFGERTGLLRLQAESPRPPVAIRGRFPLARPIVLGGIAAVVAALVLAPTVAFEYRFGTLEPRFDDYREKRDVIREVYPNDGRRNAAYIVTERPEQIPGVAAALRQRVAADTVSPTIAEVVTIQDRFPMSPEAQRAKLARIAGIRELLQDPLLTGPQPADDDSEDLRRLRRAASTTTAIEIDDVPASLRDPFVSKSGVVGNFLRIYPGVGLSDGRASIAFSEDVSNVTGPDGTVYHAGSPTIVAADVLRLVQAESPWMVLATAVLVALLMGANFGSLRWAGLACLPLVVGVLWMMLWMEVLQMRLNFYNMVVLPTVLGIGNDAGAHLVHRYREEGPGSIRRVLRSTGEHITMGSLTTVIGFSGPLLSFHPGLRTIGELAIVGVGTTWLAAVLFTPALLQWLEDRRSPAAATASPARD
jgi:predicted RND superfamily exporter protein